MKPCIVERLEKMVVNPDSLWEDPDLTNWRHKSIEPEITQKSFYRKIRT